MAEFCACNDTLIVTGTPNKQRVVATGVKLIAVNMKADDGTANVIANTDEITPEYVQARINDEDKSKRWYPIGVFENQEDVRADTVKETLASGAGVITQKGVRTYTGWLINYAPAYLKALKSFNCQSFGLYVIDDCGGLTGSLNASGTALRPIRVNENSWDPVYVKGLPTVSAKIQLMFEFSQLEQDSNLRVISDTEITADLLDEDGLLPIGATVSAISTTGFTAALKVDYDVFLEESKTVVPNWVVGDFQLFNNNTATFIVITSVTEAPLGTYTFDIPAQTAGDVLTLTNFKTPVTKPGVNLETEITVA